MLRAMCVLACILGLSPAVSVAADAELKALMNQERTRMMALPNGHLAGLVSAPIAGDETTFKFSASPLSEHGHDEASSGTPFQYHPSCCFDSAPR